MATNWMGRGAIWSRGDFNGNGTVDDKEATPMTANWHSTWIRSAASVPEPDCGELLMSLIAAFALFYRESKARR